jgi:cell division protein FtsB
MKWVTAVLVLLLLGLQYKLWIGEGSVAEVWQLRKTLEAQQAENEELRNRNSALDAEVTDLKTGLDAIEERARRELGMIRSDETFFQVVEQTKDDPYDR